MSTSLPPTTLLIIHLLMCIPALITLLMMLLLSTIPRAPIALVIPASMMRHQMLRHDGGASLQINIHAAGVGLGCVLEAELLAYLFDFGFDLLDVAG